MAPIDRGRGRTVNTYSAYDHRGRLHTITQAEMDRWMDARATLITAYYCGPEGAIGVARRELDAVCPLSDDYVVA
jgi:hypothetical protein